MKAIIAVNNLGFIGLNNKIPWRSSEDFKHFKQLTIQGGSLLVGYNAEQDLPELKGRLIFVDDRECFDAEYDWLIGGKKTYEKYAPYITELHVSHINDNTIGDCLFPDLSKLNPNCKIFNYNFEVNKQ